MRHGIAALSAATLILPLLAGCAGAEHRREDAHGHGAAGTAGRHHRFEDAEEWARVFDADGRDEWQRPDHVLTFLDLPRDAKVADIGSSTGYFAVRFARALPEGRVYGVDIEPNMDRYLRERAVDEGLENLIGVLGLPDDPRIPEPVDLIFLCNTYHHIEGRAEYFAERRRDLLPGGRIAVVDYLPGDLPVGPPPAMKIAPEAVAEEMNQAGFRMVTRDGGLPYQYILLFEKSKDPGF
ncbi:MAG: methyltransferase domain-containing protein [Candidatus Eisenbacteria bacterium]